MRAGLHRDDVGERQPTGMSGQACEARGAERVEPRRVGHLPEAHEIQLDEVCVAWT